MIATPKLQQRLFCGTGLCKYRSGHIPTFVSAAVSGQVAMFAPLLARQGRQIITDPAFRVEAVWSNIESHLGPKVLCPSYQFFSFCPPCRQLKGQPPE